MPKKIMFVMSDKAYHQMKVLQEDRGEQYLSALIRDGLKWLGTLEKYKENGEITIVRRNGDRITFEV